MTQPLIITCVGMQEQEANAFKSLVTILERKLEHTFEFCDKRVADVVLVKTQVESDFQTWKSRFELFPETEHFFAVSSGQPQDSELSLSLPLRPPQLIKVLNSITRTETAAAVQAAADDSDRLLQQLVRNARSGAVGINADQPGSPLPTLFVDNKNAQYFFDGTAAELKKFCQRDLTPADIESVNQTTWAGLAPKSLVELFWTAAFTGSRGQLLESVPQKATYKLRQWPDLRLAPQVAEVHRLSAFLTQHTASLAQIAEHTQIKIETVVAFLNACEMSGLLIADAEPERPAIQRNAKRVGLVALIRSKLGF